MVYFVLGGDPSQLTNALQDGTGFTIETAGESTAEQIEMGEFVSVVLADIEDVWTEQLRKGGRKLRAPKLVLFSGRVDSACGYAGAAVGPFYCSGDERIYIDLDYFEDMQRDEPLTVDGLTMMEMMGRVIEENRSESIGPAE